MIGYHGCDREVAKKVLVDGEDLKKSRNRYDWLGEGIYFWEHGPERALEFAQEQVKRGKVNDPVVLGAYIHFGRCLDLTDTWFTEELYDFYERLKAEFDAAEREMPVNQAASEGDHDLLLRFLDCAVLNFGLQTLDRQEGGTFYQTVRGVFLEGGEVFPGSKIMKKTHIQIAVRDPNCVVGYFRPKLYDGSQEGT